MSDSSGYTVSAALPYANGPLHIGHLAGVYVPADIYVRYLRSKGRDVLFVCGSDEHGVPITIRARKEGVSPQSIVDKYHKIISESFQEFGIDFDIYSRTSNRTHHETASEFFTNLETKGILEVKESEQFFDAEAGQFLADRYITGTCPNCGFEEAYGDQCESCGTSLSPSELINPKSGLSGSEPVMKMTKHWYLPLGKYEDWLREWIIEGHKSDWKVNVYGQCKSWIDQGLQSRAVTRDLDWGVDVPLDETSGKVLYVWFDAPIGYISATKEWAEANGKDWRPYWQDADRTLIHFIGKDNIVFHCIIFPVMLHAHGAYILPQNVPANEFLNLEGNKISTSKNWAVWLHEYLEELPGKQDVLRYVLCANAPEAKDNDFTWSDFQARNNNELVAIYGNFVNRAVVLTHKFFDGKVPGVGDLTDRDKELISSLAEFPGVIGSHIEHFKFRDSLNSLMDLARLGNKYLAETEPWKLVDSDPGRVGTILNLALQIVANLAIVSEPFLPATAGKVRDILGLKATSWEDSGQIELLPPGQKLNNAALLFEKIEDEVVEKQVKKLKGNSQLDKTYEKTPDPAKNDNNSGEHFKEEVKFDDFVKLDVRICEILHAEKVDKSNKLLKLKIDTGQDERTILSGIANFYSPEEIVGKKIPVLINLAPRKIMGIDSQGMVLMAENGDGNLSFLEPDKTIDTGSIIS